MQDRALWQLDMITLAGVSFTSGWGGDVLNLSAVCGLPGVGAEGEPPGVLRRAPERGAGQHQRQGAQPVWSAGGVCGV